MHFLTAAFVLLLSSAVVAGEFPVEGGYGFDWLQPQTTACRRITPADAQGFKECTFAKAGYAFGLPSTYHTCTASPKSEYLVYETQAHCQEAFETMQANGP